MVTINQLVNLGRSKKKRSIKRPALQHNPQKKRGVSSCFNKNS